MADNITLNAGTGGAVVAADDISSVFFQRVKLTDGTADSTEAIAGDARYGLDVDVTRFPTGILDTFGKLQTVNSINDIDIQWYRDVPANLGTVTTASGGTATRVTGLLQMASGTNITGEVKVVSPDSVLYRSGGEIYCLVTAAFLDGGVASCNQRIGLYDTSNGFYLGYEGTSFGVVVRTGGVDGTQTAKASFNVDTLTGAAGSKFTRAGTPEAIDLTKLNIFRIRFGWLGAAPVRFEVVSPDGEWVLFHIVRQPNLSATPSIQSVDIPITAHIVKTAGATDVRINTACWGAGSTYDKVDIVGSNTLTTTANDVVNYNTQGIGTLQVRVGTTTTGTIIFEASVDGATWITHPACFLMGAAGSADTQFTAAVTPTSGNIFRMQCAGFRAVRARTATTLGASVVLHAQGDAKATMLNIVGGVAGNVAHDAIEVGYPVATGALAVAHNAAPTAVAAADRVRAIANRHGVPFIIGGHPHVQTTRLQFTAAQTNTALITVSAGTKIVVTALQVTLDNASTVFPSVLIGFAAATTPTSTGVIAAHGGIPAGGGFSRGDGSGILGIGADGEDLRITTSGVATGNGVEVVVTWYEVPS
jgi:hypothetical protein